MTYRHRPFMPLACAGAALLLLPACSSGSPEAGRPNTTPGSTSAPTLTAPTATPSIPTAAPERPNPAEGLTLAAAESFVYYYSDLLNYASDTGVGTELLAASDSGCERCHLYADFVKKSNAANGLLTGDYHEHTKEVSELVRGESGRLGGSSTVTVGAYVSKETVSATPITSKPKKYTREFALSPQDGNWVMYEMKFVEQ